jgi:hypothetical protein
VLVIRLFDQRVPLLQPELPDQKYEIDHYQNVKNLFHTKTDSLLTFARP